MYTPFCPEQDFSVYDTCKLYHAHAGTRELYYLLYDIIFLGEVKKCTQHNNEITISENCHNLFKSSTIFDHTMG